MIPLTIEQQSVFGNPHATRLARLWQITRTDGKQIRLTDHDRLIWFLAQDYSPVSSFSAASHDKETGGRPHWTEGRGIVSSDKITEEDLTARRFDNAVVFEYLVDWRYPWAGALVIDKYKMRSVEWTREAWQAELAGYPQDLETRTGAEFQPSCPHRLGDLSTATVAKCDVDLVAGGHIHSGIVTNWIENDRQVFGVQLSSAFSERHFDFGRMLISDTESLNTLLEEDIAYSEAGLDLGGGGSGPWEHRLTLAQPLPHPIHAGATVVVTAGCDGLTRSCGPKFNNMDNFGGYEDAPGSDKVFELPK